MHPRTSLVGAVHYVAWSEIPYSLKELTSLENMTFSALEFPPLLNPKHSRP